MAIADHLILKFVKSETAKLSTMHLFGEKKILPALVGYSIIKLKTVENGADTLFVLFCAKSSKFLQSFVLSQMPLCEYNS